GGAPAMSKPTATYDGKEFERESERLAGLVWDATGIGAGDRVLLCGYGPDPGVIRRALAEGAEVTVIESRDEVMKRNQDLGAKVLRGSTSAIPARPNSFDVAVANSYLHEIDPLFHANVVQELSRVGLRVVIVEPMPPSDPIGKRIATLYSRAKRELGQFEYYQAPSYWRKLLSMSKAQIAEAVFAFAKVPPREYLIDTLNLLLDTMRVEDAPQYYIDQLRELAEQPGAQLLPQGRMVLVGTPEHGVAIPAKSMAAMLAAGHGPESATSPPAAAQPTQATAEQAAPMHPPAQRQSETSTPTEPAAPEPQPFNLPPAPTQIAGDDLGEPAAQEQGFGAPPGFDQPPSGWHWEPPEDAGET
ncbi:MAG: hypothetical protein KGM44_04765, partial [bacterium]|nr:hypothetical protein [bacterium]